MIVTVTVAVAPSGYAEAPGAVFLGAVAILPFIALAAGNVQSFPFGGTSILITVGVGLETMKQIESQLLMRNYEGFLR